MFPRSFYHVVSCYTESHVPVKKLSSPHYFSVLNSVCTLAELLLCCASPSSKSDSNKTTHTCRALLRHACNNDCNAMHMLNSYCRLLYRQVHNKNFTRNLEENVIFPLQNDIKGLGGWALNSYYSKAREGYSL